MSHRAKYRLEEKMNVLNEYDRGKPTKIIAEQYKIPISTVLYFIRHRNRFETESISRYHEDELISRMMTASPSVPKKIRFAKSSSDDMGNGGERLTKTKKKRKRASLLVSPLDNQDNQSGLDQEGSGNGIRIRKIPFDMKMKIIKAWEDRQGCDQAANPTSGLSMKKIAEYFGVSTRSVSRCIADREHLKSLMSMVSKVIDEVEDQAMEEEEEEEDSHHEPHPLPGTANVTINALENGSERSLSTASQPIDDNVSDEHHSDSEEEPEITISADHLNTIKTESLDGELVESVTVVFDKLKRIKAISQRLTPPLNHDAMQFAEAMIQTANSCVERILSRVPQSTTNSSSD